MAASATDLAMVRRMAADPAPGEFADAELTGMIEKYPLSSGYDLNAAARDVWELKAAALVEAEESFTADGKQFQYGQLYSKAMRMRGFYDGKANALYSGSGYVSVQRDDVDWTGQGLPEGPVRTDFDRWQL
jgi:hypothetical protein